jgi:predicted lactoylglutathione lyase
MIGYVTLGTNDIGKARAFYDALLGGIGASRMFEMPENDFTMYGRSMQEPMIVITRPHDGGEARPGNGNMVALQLGSRADVDRVHSHALELGGSDEGAPGIRPPEAMGFYAAYFRDPEGHKFCVFNLGQG